MPIDQPSAVRRRRLKIEAQIEKQMGYLKELQEGCPHPAVIKTYKSNTGNYDPSADIYWIDWHCPHCDKRWTTDQ